MLRFFLSAALLVAVSASAQAQMNGTTMDAEWIYPSFGSVLESHSVTVGPGIELPDTAIVNDTKFSIDIGDDYVEFQFNALSTWTNASFNGWLFRDAFNGMPPITGYTVDSFSAGIGGTGGIVTGFNSDEFWADFGGMTVAGPGDWIRLKVSFNAPVLAITNLVAGQTATVTVSNATTNGLVGIGYSLSGLGPITANTGACGSLTFDLSAPIFLLGIFQAVGTTMTLNPVVPPGAQGLVIYVQGLDFGSCTVTNPLALTVQ